MNNVLHYGIMLYLMNVFSIVQEAEDDEHTEGDGSSTDDGYPKDKRHVLCAINVFYIP